MAHQTIVKFDRIAQREFSKHAISIASIDLDIQLLQHIQLHPRVCHMSNSIQLDPLTTLGTFVPLKELEKYKQQILKKYDTLVTATLEQKNKVVHLHQQTSNVSTQRTTSDIVIQRVQKLKNKVDRFTISILEIQKRIYNELQKTSDTSTDIPTPPRSVSADGGMNGSSTLTIRYPLSPSLHTTQKKKAHNTLLDAVRSLYLHETLVHQAGKSIVEEKQTAVASFIRCMQAISTVEESITQIYPRLADLENDIKLLRHEIEKGKGSKAKRVIAGYVRGLTRKGKRRYLNDHTLGYTFD